MKNKHIAPAAIAFLFSAGGMVGLYLQIEYSGWLLAVGVITALFHDWD